MFVCWLLGLLVWVLVAVWLSSTGNRRYYYVGGWLVLLLSLFNLLLFCVGWLVCGGLVVYLIC